jgi:hypothetical protein
MADFGLLRRPDGDEPMHAQRAADELVAFAAAGLRAT